MFTVHSLPFFLSYSCLLYPVLLFLHGYKFQHSIRIRITLLEQVYLTLDIRHSV
uniref:Uncharacterized protein n=1 Tax=Anguilla anguilla TaxID=7936 RepID=A0A0E9THH4_ANGAN